MYPINTRVVSAGDLPYFTGMVIGHGFISGDPVYLVRLDGKYWTQDRHGLTHSTLVCYPDTIKDLKSVGRPAGRVSS